MAVHAESFASKLDFEPYGSYSMNEDSEDDNIWDCLDIMPTPPLSPDRQQFMTDNSSNCLADKLLQVSETLDFENGLLIDVLGDTNSIFQGGSKLRSSLIQDCMWNAGNCETDKKNLVNANISAFDTPCATPPRAEEFISTSDCVDPITVFPYTLSDQGQQQFGDAQSDSEEEIDVVTVEKPNKRKISSIELQQPKVEDLQSPTKRAKSPQVSSKSKETCTTAKASSTIKPDVDNDVKRATHNVLERKRRNDLRYSFQTLRDQIPDLEDNERAPKVNILKKSTEYIKSLKEEESKLMSMKDAEKEKRKALLAKIEILKSKRN